MVLKRKDLKQVRRLLFSISEKWYDIGVELELDTRELDIICAKGEHDARCLLFMIKLWLNSTKTPPTWSFLAEALRSGPVNEEGLAEEAESKSDVALNGEQEAPTAQNPTADHEVKSRCSRKKECVVKAIAEWMKEKFSTSSFHGALNAEEAKIRLVKQDNHCSYLTRYSESMEKHILSVLIQKEDEDVFQNFHIKVEHNQVGDTTFEIDGTGKKHDSIEELLQYYKDHPLNYRIERIGTEVSSDLVCADETKEIPTVIEESNESPISTPPSDPTTDIEENGEVGTPTLQLLTLIKWTDSNGVERSYNLVDQISSKWEDVVIRLKLNHRRDNYKQNNADNEQCLKDVFTDWIHQNGHPPEYPLTWVGVFQLLQDVGMTTAAEDLKKALESKGLTF